MDKDKKYNKLFHLYTYVHEGKESVHFIVNFNCSINDIISSDKMTDNKTETILICKLTKKGKLKLIYSKENVL